MKTILNIGTSPHANKPSHSSKKQQIIYVTTIFTMAALLFAGVGAVSARPMYATAPGLGIAGDFAVLAGTTATNTGPTIVDGDLGVSPGTAIVGFPPGTVTNGTHSADAVALQAQNDTTTAYNNLAGQPCDSDLTGQDLGGLTLIPGIYCFPNTSAGLTGALTLDAQGNPAAVFVFKIGSTLTTATDASVIMINGAADCNVFWQVGSSATLGTRTSFVGNILALTSITMNTNVSLSGRALARNGAVTMDSNNISALCPAATPTNTPEPTDEDEDEDATPTTPGEGTPGAGTPGPGAGTPVSTPVVPIGASTPTALEPIGQPKQAPLTLYMPFGSK